MSQNSMVLGDLPRLGQLRCQRKSKFAGHLLELNYRDFAKSAPNNFKSMIAGSYPTCFDLPTETTKTKKHVSGKKYIRWVRSNTICR